MNNPQHIIVDGVVIGRDHWDVPVQVQVRSYLRFNRRMDRQLRRLVIGWLHAASPWARNASVVEEQSEDATPPVF
jgi:hypothetical protein